MVGEQLLAAALTCADAAIELTSGQLTACGDEVPAAVEQLIDAQYSGTMPEIEAAARALSIAVNTACPLPDEAAVGAFVGAVLHLHGRLRQFDEATQAAQTTRPLASGSPQMKAADECTAPNGRLDGGINIVVQVAEQPSPPHQLPAVRPVTRPHVQATVDQIWRLFRERAGEPQLIVVSGPPGVGATTAAVAFLTPLIRGDGWDLHVDLNHADDPPYEPGDILHQLLLDVGVPSEHVPAGTDERAALWRSLADEPLLLIDGAVTAAQVRPLLPGLGGVVVVTSHKPLIGLMKDGARLTPIATEPTEEDTDNG